MDRSTSIENVKGIGPKTKELLNQTGVYTVGDILLRFPRDYFQYPPMILPSDLNEDNFVEGKKYGLNIRITKTPTVRSARNRKLNITAVYESGVELLWFNAPFIKNQLEIGKHYVFFGSLRKKGKHLTMDHPKIFTPEDYLSDQGVIFPVYSLSKGLTNNFYTKTIGSILEDSALMMDYLPDSIRNSCHLCEYNYAIKQMHFPDRENSLIEARNRLVFDEFFLFILGLRYHREKEIREKNDYHFCDFSEMNPVIQNLPFHLTDGQTNSLKDIVSDLSGAYRMQRLLQGDVGSGKTIIAFLIMAWCSKSGFQSAIMAPTEVLASQHFETFQKYCRDFGIDAPVVLLTGQMKAGDKRAAYETIKNNPNALIIGTHALIQEKTTFHDLALVITDEQHRFGVKQRESFSNKGALPNILVMSATPIPRTLAIIIYGDLDISTIDHVPSDRLPIKNCVVGTKFRPKAYEFIKNEVLNGHQAYIICPMVEESENLDGENVIDYSKRVQESLGTEIKVSYLHGKMKGAEKIKIMESFLKNEIQVLVSTTVVEVGVNVPNATVMMVENADRFGLAQLHQLRGRVGRGPAQSYCIFVNTSTGDTAKKRLNILNESNDGFKIANADLKLRGPGDFFGIRQSGELAFKLADIYQDAGELQAAQQAVTTLLEEDSELASEENKKLRHEMETYMSQQFEKMNL